MQHPIKDEQLIFQLFANQTASAIWLKPVYASADNTKGEIVDFEICYCNEAAAKMLNISKQAALNKCLLKDKLLKGKSEDLIFDQAIEVFLQNTSKEFTYYNAYLQKYLRVVRTRVNDGIFNIAYDITKQVTAENKIQEQSDILNAILDASINAVFICEAIRDEDGKIVDLRITKINRAFTELIGKTPAEVEGRSFLSLFPATGSNGLFDLNCQVIETGKPVRKEVYYNGDNLDGWYDISLIKVGTSSLLVTFTVVTKEKQAMLHMKRQKTLLNNVLKHSPSGICVIEVLRDESGQPADGFVIVANDAAARITGISKEGIKHKISLIDPKILVNGLFQKALTILETGKPLLTQYFLDSLEKWLELGISKMDENRLIIVFTDITSSKLVQLGVEKSANQLLNFINTAHSGISYLLPEKDETGEVFDFRFGITNNTFAGFVGQKPETLKDVPVSRYFPSYKKDGLFHRYKYTYDTGQTSRFESRYLEGNIEGWFEIISTKMEDGVLVTVTELTNLKKLQIDLENSVNELKKSNESLQEFAYVASHDLQEPLRKIQVFSERLQKDLGKTLDEENKRVFERMVAATQRMSQLINDLLSYSQLSTKPPAFITINLNNLVQHVLNDLEATINEKKATVLVGELPAVKGDPVQLRQLFQNLLSNSLKYSKENDPPVIAIKSEIVRKERNVANDTYYSIEIQDNGIGFEQQNAERIFKVFQRLHGRSEYPGTGIGLAIVQKVVENHNGSITAESEPEKGATFKVYLPVN
jgi:signal transduction histidine kinase/PAS domain-containing protein